MEFYKLVQRDGAYQLEEEAGQDGTVLDNGALSRLAGMLHSCYLQQENLPLRFRKYLTAYYTTGEMEYMALAEAESLVQKPAMDGFATTWLEGEEENRVWLGVDGAIENRGPSAERVRYILDLLVEGLQQGTSEVTVPEGASALFDVSCVQDAADRC